MDRKWDVVSRREIFRQETLDSGSDRESDGTLETYTHLCNCIIRVIRHIVEFRGYGIVSRFEIKVLQY